MDNSVTKIVMGTEYNVRDCNLIPVGDSRTLTIDLIRIKVADRDGSSNNSDPYGFIKWDETGEYFWHIPFVNYINGKEELSGAELNSNPITEYFTDIQGNEVITLSWEIWDLDDENNESASQILALGSKALDLADIQDGLGTYVEYYSGLRFEFDMQFSSAVYTE